MEATHFHLSAICRMAKMPEPLPIPMDIPSDTLSSTAVQAAAFFPASTDTLAVFDKKTCGFTLDAAPTN